MDVSFDAMLVDGFFCFFVKEKQIYLTGQGVKAQVRSLVRYSPQYRLGNIEKLLYLFLLKIKNRK